MQTVSRRGVTFVAVVAAGLVTASTAGAHGTLTPAAAAAGVSQRFELVVPNARLDADIVGISLELPPGAVLESAEAAQPLWAVTSDESSVRWSGGPIDRGSAETFTFTARLPTDPGPAEFALVESYDDGDLAPFPITIVATGPTASADGSEGTLAGIAVALAVLSLLVSTFALALVLRLHRRSDQP